MEILSNEDANRLYRLRFTGKSHSEHDLKDYEEKYKEHIESIVINYAGAYATIIAAADRLGCSPVWLYVAYTLSLTPGEVSGFYNKLGIDHIFFGQTVFQEDDFKSFYNVNQSDLDRSKRKNIPLTELLKGHVQQRVQNVSQRAKDLSKASSYSAEFRNHRRDQTKRPVLGAID